MDIIAAYREVGTYRGAAEMCGTCHKTVRRVIELHEAGERPVGRAERARNYDIVRDLVAKRVETTRARISAKRLLPEAKAAGYTGSARNFRRLVRRCKDAWRANHHRGRRPGVWAPGETLVIDWGTEDGLHVFCAVSAWSRFRFVRFALDEGAETTLGMLAECFEVLGGVPKVVLSDRMACLKGGVAAGIVVPTPAYVRFATHYLLTELHQVNTQMRGHVWDPPWRVDVLLDNRPHDRRARPIKRSGHPGRAPGRPAGGHRGPVGALPAHRLGRVGSGSGVGVVR
jgi:hypothetical protein